MKREIKPAKKPVIQTEKYVEHPIDRLHIITDELRAILEAWCNLQPSDQRVHNGLTSLAYSVSDNLDRTLVELRRVWEKECGVNKPN